MKKQYENSKYGRAKKRVDDIKGFYSHLTVYIVINILIFAVKVRLFEGELKDVDVHFWGYWSTPVFWGIGLFFHGLWVFSGSFKSIKRWEERKIEQFMQEDIEDEEKIKY
jgi:hypothetical protein